MTDVLHKLGVSVDYMCILRIEIQLAQAVLSHSDDNSIYIPPALTKGQFIYFAVDNSDFSEDTLEGENTLQATAMAIFKRQTVNAPKTYIRCQQESQIQISTNKLNS